jgi:hypothetical protein
MWIKVGKEGKIDQNLQQNRLIRFIKYTIFPASNTAINLLEQIKQEVMPLSEFDPPTQAPSNRNLHPVVRGMQTAKPAKASEGAKGFLKEGYILTFFLENRAFAQQGGGQVQQTGRQCTHSPKGAAMPGVQAVRGQSSVFAHLPRQREAYETAHAKVPLRRRLHVEQGHCPCTY